MMKLLLTLLALAVSSCGFQATPFVKPEGEFYGIEVLSGRMDNENAAVKRKLWIMLNNEGEVGADLLKYNYTLRFSVQKDVGFSAIESDAFLANKTITLKVKYGIRSRDGKLLYSGEEEVDGSYSAVSSSKLVSEYMTDKSLSNELSEQVADSIYYSIKVAILRGELKLEH